MQLKHCLSLFIISIFFLASCSTSELYLIQQNAKWGFIDKKGEIVIEPFFENCCFQRYEDTCCSRIIYPGEIGIIKQNGKYGAINLEGEVKIEAKYDFLDQYYNSLIVAQSGGKYGVLNNVGDTIFPFIFDNQFISCNCNIGHGQINSEYYLLDFNKGTKRKTNFDKISYFVEDYASVNKSGLYGFINKNGKIVIDIKFQNTWPFNNGLAAVKQNYQWGFIDTTGTFIIAPQYDETEGFDLFTGKYAIVVKNNKYGIIDRTGNYIIAPKYEYLFFEDENILNATLLIDSKYQRGLIDLNEKWLFINNFESFDYFGGYLKVEKKNKFGLLKLKNKNLILPIIFDDIAFRNNGLTLLSWYFEKTNNYCFAYVNRKGKIIWKEKEFPNFKNNP